MTALIKLSNLQLVKAFREAKKLGLSSEFRFVLKNELKRIGIHLVKKSIFLKNRGTIKR